MRAGKVEVKSPSGERLILAYLFKQSGIRFSLYKFA